MTDAPQPVGEQAYEPPAGAAGAALRAAREAAGLTIDVVAQQLKLAPRQVRALEDGDYRLLPGRTFVRGFTRNYARLLQLDAETLVAMLPQAESSPALDTPTIGSSVKPMGELRDSSGTRGPRWSRWAIPLALIAVIGIAAVYEFSRPTTQPPAEAPRASDTNRPVASSGIALPNPLVPSDAPVETPRSESAPAAATTTGPAAQPIAPAATGRSETATSAAASPEATLTITYRAPAWTEVRDRAGNVLYTGTAPGGTTQTLTGSPPLDLTLGNANQTSVSWRGAPYDLNPHIQKNIARVRLQ
jgi:cytoskeleton protein RodZ